MNAEDDAPFHAGERAVQDRAGTRARMAVAGPRLIRDYMPDEHRELFEKLPYLVLGTADAAGQPWATLLTGAPGFVATTAREMRITSLPHAPDVAARGLQPGAQIGLLGIELSTRRRNRMNGRISTVEVGGFAVDVVQSFGNCPKYIHVRQEHPTKNSGRVSAEIEAAQLGAEAGALIARADTFFIATTSGNGVQGAPRGVDVSHRGGEPGFVAVESPASGTRLTVPDYAGNGFFNSLGNLALDPRAGLLFVDLEQGHLLQLAARGMVQWDEAVAEAGKGTGRSLVLQVTGGQWLRNAIGLRWV